METQALATGKKYVKEIFGATQFYHVPEYQRPYVWQEDQVRELLDDILQAIEANASKEYFIGCMIWNTHQERDKAGTVFPVQDILDGQQRFITLFLLHAIIRDLSNHQGLKDDVQKRLVQEENIFSGIPSRNRIEFAIRSDGDFLAEYVITPDGTLRADDLKQISSDPANNNSVRNMATALITMHKWWGDRIAAIDGQKWLADFYRYLSNNVLALYLATPDNLDDAYNLFTVLNSRGLQLQVSDIFRAQNLRVIADDSARTEYAKRWAEFETSIASPFRDFDDFLWSLVFIKMKYRSDDNKTLTRAFEYMGKRGQLRTGPDTFDFVGKYVSHFEAVTNGSIAPSPSQLLFSNLNFILTSVFGNQYMMPLMHYRECFGEVGIVDFMVKMDNLLSASWLMGRRQTQTRLFIVLRRMETHLEAMAKESLTREEAVARFLNDDCLRYDFFDEQLSSEKAIDLNEFFRVLDTEKWGSYVGTRINKTRYLLLKLDLILSNINTKIQYNKDSSSIEHLMPQKPSASVWAIDSYQHAEWVHRLGNIVLIDRNKNASLSNSSFSDKRSKYGGAIETRANTNRVFLHFTHWDIQAIQQNHEYVLGLLKQWYELNSLDGVLALKRRTLPSPQALTAVPLL